MLSAKVRILAILALAAPHNLAGIAVVLGTETKSQIIRRTQMLRKLFVTTADTTPAETHPPTGKR